MTNSGPDEPGQREVEASASEDEALEGPPPTPFDHPFFLPVILIALTLWFGYDGFLNTDPEMQEHLTFNRVGFGVLLVLSAWFGYRAVQENQEIKEQEEAERRSRGDVSRD